MRINLHIHTALSACADNSMSPRRIVERAIAAGIEMLAVTDHNASANSAAAITRGRDAGIRVVPGIEITTREEVHVLAFFDELAPLLDLQKLIDCNLPKEDNAETFFGLQLIYDATDQITGVDDRLRQVGLDIGIDRITREITDRGGYAVPAHVFRARHSLTSQLGFVPENESFAAVEVGRKTWIRDGFIPGTQVCGYPAITGSDAHFLDDIDDFGIALPGTFAAVTEVFQALRDVTA